MLPSLSLAAALALLAQTVQVPVEAPHLPSGPLQVIGAMAEGDLYIDGASITRSDLPGLVGVTTVLVTETEAHVARAWIDCGRRVYQFSAGRSYDEAGAELAPTAWVPDQPLEAGTPPDLLAAAVCQEELDLGDFQVIAGHKAAVARSRAFRQVGP
jgi:hypothetical protein